MQTVVEQEPRIRSYERVPQELRARFQWVVWRPEADRKVPVNVKTLGNAGVTWPDTWASFEDALDTAARYQFGLGFVLTADDPYTCVDLDNCVGEKGEVSDKTRAILDLLSGWVELSPSMRGLHVWIKNHIPVNRRTQGIEVYSDLRWMTISGRSNPQVTQDIPERTAELQELVRRNFPHPEARTMATPRDLGPLDNGEIWERLFNDRNGAFYKSLFQGDTSVCYNDHSRAVILLANQLAVLTNMNAERVKHLLHQTALVREKWEEKRGDITWIDYQILDAIAYVSRHKK